MRKPYLLLLPLVAAVLAVGLYMALTPAGPSDAATTEPRPLSGTRPNIVLILTDDQPFESLDKMPYLSSRADWITFAHAFLQNPLCCPSRASILTGQYDTHTGVLVLYGPNGGEALDESETLAVWLQGVGYTTGMIGKYLNHYPWERGNYIPAGWNKWFAITKNSEGRYRKFNINEDGTETRYEKEYSTEVFATKALDFVRDSPEPFFLYLAPFAPHTPPVPAPQDKGTYDAMPVDHAPSFNESDVSDKPGHMQAMPLVDVASAESKRRKQWNTLPAVDRAVKGIVDELEARNILDNTVILFLTDNGYAHGEHRWIGKRCPYDVCLQTPLLVRYPGQGGRVIQDVVGNVDLAPTLVELAGARPGIGHDGKSLVPLLEGGGALDREGVLGHWSGTSSPPPFWTVRTRDHRYTEYATGERELYDYGADPYELENQAGAPALAAREAELAALLASLRNDALAPLAGPDGTEKPAIAIPAPEPESDDE